MKIVSKTEKVITDFSTNVIESYKKYSDAEKKVPQNEYEKGYKSRNYTARKLFKEFSEVCIENNLKPVETCLDLQILLKD